MFRYFGISLQAIDRANKTCRWHYRAVIDSNVYYFLLKYLIKRKLRKIKESADALQNIGYLLFGLNVRHRDVAWNVLAWCFSRERYTPKALYCLTMSWRVMHSLDLCYMIFKNDMKQKQYLFNSAKLHALVILYNTWFTRHPSMFQFCFQCFFTRLEDIQKCSRCKTATYCSRQCQQLNWRIHKQVCQIVRMYHRV